MGWRAQAAGFNPISSNNNVSPKGDKRLPLRQAKAERSCLLPLFSPAFLSLALLPSPLPFSSSLQRDLRSQIPGQGQLRSNHGKGPGGLDPSSTHVGPVLAPLLDWGHVPPEELSSKWDEQVKSCGTDIPAVPGISSLGTRLQILLQQPSRSQRSSSL